VGGGIKRGCWESISGPKVWVLVLVGSNTKTKGPLGGKVKRRGGRQNREIGGVSIGGGGGSKRRKAKGVQKKWTII